MSDILILIPARYASTRFPGKPLAMLNNKPLIDYVVENCRATGFDYSVVTDDERIECHLKENNYKVCMVKDDVPSGSERIQLAYKRFFKTGNYKLIINVQGDEPLLKSKTIQELATAHLGSDFDIFTLLKKRDNSSGSFSNSNVVKCAYSAMSKRCLYFSRSSIPFGREQSAYSFYQHIGVYSYRPSSLDMFVEFDMSPLEKLESLEQLRALENGLSIGAIETTHELLGVDTPEDMNKVSGVLDGKK